jgi:hypothetical protein
MKKSIFRAVGIATIVATFYIGCGAGGKTVPGHNLAEKLAWLQTNVQSNSDYVLEVKADESIMFQTLSYKDRSNIIITLRGIGSNRTVNLSANGSMFDIRYGVTLVLDDNITLQGRSNNTKALISVDSGGTLKMNTGSTITNNNGRGVYIGVGVFDMNGGTISGNNGSGVTIKAGTFTMNGGTISSNSGSGVYVDDDGSFTMNDGDISGNNNSGVIIGRGIFTMNSGTISGNKDDHKGGGVYVNDGGSFTMNGGTISGNTIDGDGFSHYGGGVYVEQQGTFTMSGGTISGNTAYNGGGVYVERGTFTMSGGTISRNTAAYKGGGVAMERGTSFILNNGTITGYNSNPNDGNVVRSKDGNVLSNSGHAVCIYNSYKGTTINRKETTAGSKDNLSYNNGKFSGAWDD